MKKKRFLKILGLAGTAALLALPLACATRLPIPTPKDEDRASKEDSQLRLADLQIGRKLYLENCTGCHPLHLPSELNAAVWEKVLGRMQSKTNLTDSQSDLILKYLAAFARDSKQP